ncbi:unnamed protein product [Cylindrotheca closterium]|uniref:Uncharacterized protein n=1 Tax=Cylindrotheca closterium TaxID=2856 RepID=A0AAD2CLW7_9STRA|nr:unnamed protein product [Cylindrotheca closterium]
MVSEENANDDESTAEEANPSATIRNETVQVDEEISDNDQREQQQSSHVDVNPETTFLSVSAFQNHALLKTIHLPQELKLIFENAFLGCSGLQSIKIPSNVYSIGDRAFYKSGLFQIDLREGLHTLGNLVFACTPLRLARIPASVKEMGEGTFYRCFRMISVEMPGRSFLPSQTFMHCYSLRNIALREDSSAGYRSLARCTYLSTHLPNENDRLQALQHRFDGLPVHGLCYYHTYYGSASNTERIVSKLEEIIASPSENQQQSQQDCLGMTPLHILALSSRQILPLYKVLLKHCPDDVITKDKWGDLPLHFACKIDAPLEVIQLLLEESYKTMEEPMDLGVEGILKDSNNQFSGQTARLLLQYHTKERQESLGLESWRHDVALGMDQVALEDRWSARDDRITEVLRKLTTFETKESTALLELVFWKARMEGDGYWVGDNRSDPSIRQKYRVHCGIGIAVPNILPFLHEDEDEASLQDETM